MSESVNLPALGESVTEGTVTRWLKQVGDRVEVDEPLLEVSTDKVDTEIPSPIAGVIEEILVAEDETAEVGAPLVRIGDGSGSAGPGEAAAAPAEEAPAAAAAEAPAAEAPPPPKLPAPAAEAPAAGCRAGEGHEVTLPALGESVTEGTVTRWLKSIGDTVEVDEPLLEVSTDKVDTEIPSPVAGTLQEIRVAEDETAEVGSVLAVIGSGAAAPAAAPAKEAPKQEAAAAEAPKQEAAPAEAPKAGGPEGRKPPSRRLPHRQEAAAARCCARPPRPRSPATSPRSSASWPTSRAWTSPRWPAPASAAASASRTCWRRQKPRPLRRPPRLPRAAAAPAARPSADQSSLRGTVQKAPRIRQVIARRMRESLDISTQLTQVHEVDMTKVAKLRAKAKNSFQAQNGSKLTFLPFIAKAVAEALKQHPKVNASYDEDKQEITYHNAEHLAIAVDTDKGLLVPVIADAGNLNLAGLAGKIADVADRTRNGKIGPDELSGGTFSITNIGSVGALFDTPIINQPQVAILGTGAIVKRAVVVADENGDDSLAIRSMMYLSLTYDHRLVDGADAGRFLQTLKARLEEGAFEADLGL